MQNPYFTTLKKFSDFFICHEESMLTRCLFFKIHKTTETYLNNIMYCFLVE